MDTFWDVLGAIMLLSGSALTLVASVGMFRYDDLLTRLHIATKPQVLSLVLFVMGAAALIRVPVMTWTMVLVCLFQLITSPISSHMLARAAYRVGRVDSKDLLTDELREDLRVRTAAGDDEYDRDERADDESRADQRAAAQSADRAAGEDALGPKPTGPFAPPRR